MPTNQTDSVKISVFADFPLDFSLEFWTELKFWPKENLYLKVRATTLLIGVWSKTEPILNYELLNFRGFLKNSEIQLSLEWAEVQVCFSSVSSTELENLPKAKLEGFKSSKTFIQGPRADSWYILKYKDDNLGGSCGHLEISGVPGFNQLSLDFFMLPLV